MVLPSLYLIRFPWGSPDANLKSFAFFAFFHQTIFAIIPRDNEQKEVLCLFVAYYEGILFITDEPKIKETRY